MKQKPYRKNVGIVVFNRSGQVLTGQRREYPGYFQFPQGGIDGNESPLTAARRELKEETGLELHTSPIFEMPQWLSYEFPADIPRRLHNYRGQKQKWFFFFWDGSLAELNYKEHHEPEFSSLAWSDLKEVSEKIVPFKRETYRILYQEGQKIIPNYLSCHKL